ncbi:hypothetical protein [Chlorogloeopsis fritschii]|nr:hypothetical protein [Chlorogloeopsis fritschii]
MPIIKDINNQLETPLSREIVLIETIVLLAKFQNAIADVMSKYLNEFRV